MASGVSYQVHDRLSCTVCFERYDSSTHLPRILPCQHTFCSSCIASLLSLCDRFFECPVCRSHVSSDDVHTNLAVADIAEAVVSGEKAKLFCPSHTSKECQLVCVDCYKLLCAVCVVKGEHAGHTVDDVDDAMVAMKKRLADAVEMKIRNLDKVTTDKLAHYEQELNTIVYMFTEALNNWKKTQLQIAYQAMGKEIETSKAQQALWKQKLQISDLQSMMTACKEAEAKENTTISTDVSLLNINLEELQCKLNSLCDNIQTLIKNNGATQSSSRTPLKREKTSGSHISWDFIVHLCNSALPQNDPRTCPYIPECVQRVANMYDFKRNTRFLRVVRGEHELHDRLLCKTDDFVFYYHCSENKKHGVNGLWDPRVSPDVEFLEKGTDLLHDPKYITQIRDALERWQKRTLYNMRNGVIKLAGWSY